MTNTLHRLLDVAFRIDSNAVLNDGVAAQTSDSGVAANIKRALTMLKAQAYDDRSARFDYARVRASETYRAMRECTGRVNTFDPGTLPTRQERMAFWINLYNALILDAVISFDVRDSVTKDLGFFRRAAYRVGGMRFSADDIEHGILRGNRRHPLFPFPQFSHDDPRLAFSIQPMDVRIHAALNCASRSCPPILVYDAAHLDAQLDQAMRAFVNGAAQINSTNGVICISRIFQWYADDFGGREGVIELILRGWNEELAQAWLEPNHAKVRFEYSRYDWRLNGLDNGYSLFKISSRHHPQ
ncbi:hypothetical protein ANRL3_02664 [Anaerolineae bacterium]|nr:hypothetical protein ANRL3_02664 [Anaerolineae bacterium]